MSEDILLKAMAELQQERNELSKAVALANQRIKELEAYASASALRSNARIAELEGERTGILNANSVQFQEIQKLQQRIAELEGLLEKKGNEDRTKKRIAELEHNWQEEARFSRAIIDARDQRIAELEEFVRWAIHTDEEREWAEALLEKGKK